MSDVRVEPARRADAVSAIAGSIRTPQAPLEALAAAPILFLGFNHILLLSFLGIDNALGALAIAGLSGGAALSVFRAQRHLPATEVSASTLAACGAIALVLCLLGGQGHVAYANIDWQVRDAVLQDMARFPWPFAYASPDPAILRAPIGIYLLPALAGKWLGGAAADWMLLVQNALLLGALLALGSLLARNARERLVLLAVFFAFSGMDVIGQLLVDPREVAGPAAHIERWSGGEYSSHLTMAFWVPNHALPGWFVAVSFMLWSARKLPLAALLAPLPLLALWSPLAVMGGLPFALYAAVRTLPRWRELFTVGLTCLATTIVSVPSLLYLASDSAEVGWRLQPEYLSNGYLAFQLLEAVPFVAAAWALRRCHDVPPAVIVLCGILLGFLPLVEIGQNHDFMMRASIPSLAILAVAIGQGLSRWPRPRLIGVRWIAVVLAVGAVTPAMQLARATLYLPSPHVRCSFFAAWDQSFAAFRKTTYLARQDHVPAFLQPAEMHVVDPIAGPCWDGEWRRPRF